MSASSPSRRCAITLIRDGGGLVPLAVGGSVMVVQYAPETELRAGRVFGPAVRAGRVAIHRSTGDTAGPGPPPMTELARLGPGATADLLDSLGRAADGSATVIVAAYVRRVEGSGSVALPARIATWIDSLALRRNVIVVAFGNPYLMARLPNVDAYIAAYGVSDDLERAAARALLGQAAVTGRTPISLPGLFQAGDGLERAARDTGPINPPR